jgi:hypothetical protein
LILSHIHISSSKPQSVSLGFRPYMNVSHKSNNNAIETFVLSQPNVSGGCNPTRQSQTSK